MPCGSRYMTGRTGLCQVGARVFIASSAFIRDKPWPAPGVVFCGGGWACQKRGGGKTTALILFKNSARPKENNNLPGRRPIRQKRGAGSRAREAPEEQDLDTPTRSADQSRSRGGRQGGQEGEMEKSTFHATESTKTMHDVPRPSLRMTSARRSGPVPGDLGIECRIDD